MRLISPGIITAIVLACGGRANWITVLLWLRPATCIRHWKTSPSSSRCNSPTSVLRFSNREQLDELLIPPRLGDYAAGWGVSTSGEELWIGHGGGGGLCCGYLALMNAVPSHGRAYIAVANSWDDDDTWDLLDSITDSLIDHILP